MISNENPLGDLRIMTSRRNLFCPYEKAVINFAQRTLSGISVEQFGEKYENDDDIVFNRIREKYREILIFVVCRIDDRCV